MTPVAGLIEIFGVRNLVPKLLHNHFNTKPANVKTNHQTDAKRIVFSIEKVWKTKTSYVLQRNAIQTFQSVSCLITVWNCSRVTRQESSVCVTVKVINITSQQNKRCWEVSQHEVACSPPTPLLLCVNDFIYSDYRCIWEICRQLAVHANTLCSLKPSRLRDFLSHV